MYWIYAMVVRPNADTVWWPRVKLKTNKAEPDELQRMACLGITGAMRTAALEVLIGLPPLHLQLEAEARAGLYCSNQWKPKSEGFGHAYMTQGMNPSYRWRLTVIPRHVYDRPFTVIFPDGSEWKDGVQPDRK
jgi:hypothetical protein